MPQSLSVPLARLPMSMVARTIDSQRPAIPLFGPSPPAAGLPDRLIDASALYAGETALRIDSLLSASEAVERLVDATISSS